MESAEVVIDGCIHHPDVTDSDELMDLFIEAIEAKGIYFGGGMWEYKGEDETQIK